MSKERKANNGKKTAAKNALKAAFPRTIPIMTGFLFLGAAYGIYARAEGFSALLPIIMAATIFAGSMEFVTVDLLTGVTLGAFDPLSAFFLAVTVNARHIFYGLSMLEKYGSIEPKKRAYIIFGMCDESFSINSTAEIPAGIDAGWFYFFVTLLNQLYWVAGAALGALAGTFIKVQLQGLEFVMTALLAVIFLDNLLKEKNHAGSLTGVICALICLVVFGSENFIIPAMCVILLVLTLLRKPIERAVDAREKEGE